MKEAKRSMPFLLLFINKDNKSCVITLRVKWGDKDQCYIIFCMKHTLVAVLGEEWDHRAGVLVRKDIPWTDEEITALLQTLGHSPPFPWCSWFGPSANVVAVTGQLSFNISIIHIGGERGPQPGITLVPPLSRSKLS